MPIPYGGDRVARVDSALASAFVEGDRILVVQDSGDILHIPSEDWSRAQDSVAQAHGAFQQMSAVTETDLDSFFLRFAARLADDAVFARVKEANREDVERAREQGRSTTRLVLSDEMRVGMLEGLREWASLPPLRGEVVETVDQEGLRLDLVRAPLGVVGFVFEGRPNVFADAAGVLKMGNTAALRIGSAALGTARALVEHALDPSIEESGLPKGAISLVDAPGRAAGWALFSDPRLSLAVARGSGPAVGQLGAVARQRGTPVSLHGTGGAWIVAASSADAGRVSLSVVASLDRKVCNTLNTFCVVESRAEELVPVFLDAMEKAGRMRGANPKVHFTPSAASLIPRSWFDGALIGRAGGPVMEPRAEELDRNALGQEWEWEDSPEVTLTVVEDVEKAVALFNEQSPRFMASLISEDRSEHERFFAQIDSPFTGDGMTRWVDGQYALGKPELGLSNWEHGRLFSRGGILTGDSIYTVRVRARQQDPGLNRWASLEGESLTFEG